MRMPGVCACACACAYLTSVNKALANITLEVKYYNLGREVRING